MSLDRYVEELQNGIGKKRKITNEDILAPEFILTQGLRFTFDVKHPFRALRGVYIEIQAMAEGTAVLLPGEGRSAQELQQAIRALPRKTGGPSQQQSADMIQERMKQAYGRARNTLGAEAILTDAYFLYTPPQIMFAALLLADEPLMTFYLSTKFPSSASTDSVKNKIIATIRQCSEILQAGPTFQHLKKEELIRIDKKLYRCQNPEKLDLVSLNKAQKRDDVTSGKLDESVAKKRKLEREKSMKEGDDLFGPALDSGAEKG